MIICYIEQKSVQNPTRISKKNENDMSFVVLKFFVLKGTLCSKIFLWLVLDYSKDILKKIKMYTLSIFLIRYFGEFEIFFYIGQKSVQNPTRISKKKTNDMSFVVTKFFVLKGALCSKIFLWVAFDYFKDILKKIKMYTLIFFLISNFFDKRICFFYSWFSVQDWF